MATLDRELWAEAYKVYQAWGQQIQARKRTCDERADLWMQIAPDIGKRAGSDKMKIILYSAVIDMLVAVDEQMNAKE